MASMENRMERAEERLRELAGTLQAVESKQEACMAMIKNLQAMVNQMEAVATDGKTAGGSSSNRVVEEQTTMHPAVHAHHPRLELPCFDGTDAPSWIARAEQDFLVHEVPDHMRVEIAMIAMSGIARWWFRSLQRRISGVDWPTFVDEVLIRFEDVSVAKKLEESECLPDAIEAAQLLPALEDSRSRLSSHSPALKESTPRLSSPSPTPEESLLQIASQPLPNQNYMSQPNVNGQLLMGNNDSPIESVSPITLLGKLQTSSPIENKEGRSRYFRLATVARSGRGTASGRPRTAALGCSSKLRVRCRVRHCAVGRCRDSHPAIGVRREAWVQRIDRSGRPPERRRNPRPAMEDTWATGIESGRPTVVANNSSAFTKSDGASNPRFLINWVFPIWGVRRDDLLGKSAQQFEVDALVRGGVYRMRLPENICIHFDGNGQAIHELSKDLLSADPPEFELQQLSMAADGVQMLKVVGEIQRRMFVGLVDSRANHYFDSEAIVGEWNGGENVLVVLGDVECSVRTVGDSSGGSSQKNSIAGDWNWKRRHGWLREGIHPELFLMTGRDNELKEATGVG